MVQQGKGVSQGSIPSPLFSDLYKRSSDGLSTNARLFADDVSLVSVVDNINLSVVNLNSDLSKINPWGNHWKITFNLDPKKRAQEVIFSQKIKKTLHPPLNSDKDFIKQVQFQKHLGVYLDCELDFRDIFEICLKNYTNVIDYRGIFYD